MTDTPTDLTKPVRTRSGLDVRILCTDAPGKYCVEGRFTDKYGNENPAAWTAEGRFWSSGAEDGMDLVNVPETTKRYELCDVKSGLATLAAAQYHKSSGLGLIELTYEGDKLTAVKIVENE